MFVTILRGGNTLNNFEIKMDDELLSIYEPYRIANIGNRFIDPDKIIGFSLSESKILDSGKLPILEEKISEQGWIPKHLSDFELILLPDGKFTVGNGGNHRAYLSKKLKMKSVPAYIEVLIPEINISESTKIQIKDLEQDKIEIIKQVKKLTKYLNSKDNNRYLLDAEEETITSLFSEADDKDQTINELLIIEAKKLGYLSNELLESKMV